MTSIRARLCLAYTVRGRCGNATAGPGGKANTGIVAAAGVLPDDVRVEGTGHADASGGGEADSGVRLD
ncbi:hypothetical protein ACFWY5_18075 [Nonomuraea sp. NPDC059007]|uniref:hypothetical protein n=1 Tax=Nonomuraea sp. NPDC059007 TaxID=3346692 RepID=UPI0036A54E5D